MSVDYKTKYIDLRSKFLEATDVSYRLGYTDGMKDGQQQMQQQQMAEQQAMEQQMAAAQGGMPPGMEGGMPPEEDEEAGSELDQHIKGLEDMVAKGEKPSVLDMRKAVIGLSSLRKSQKTKSTNKTAKVESAQKNLVDSILKKWEKESRTVTSDLEDIIKENGIKVEG